MSGAQAAPNGGGTASPPPSDEQTRQARARRFGWRPREEFTGPEDKWVDFDDFLAKQADPAIVAHNLETMDRRYERLERDLRSTQLLLTESQRQQQEQTVLVQQMTGMVRTADQRAYDRARRDLEAQRDAAIETGDKAAVHRVDSELTELKKTEPVVITAPRPGAPAAPAPGAVPPAATPTPEEQAAVAKFYADNSWYHTDPQLRAAAESTHVAILNGERQFYPTVAANLAETVRRVKAAFPEKFRTPDGTNGAGQGGDVDADNQRRSEPGAVAPSGGGGGHRQQRSRFSFDNLPQDSKAAFRKYRTQLADKGDPLSEKEWAHSYFLQEQDYVDHIERGGAPIWP